jgi:hypothetical protein
MHTNSKSGLKVKAGVKAGGLSFNHNRSALKVRSNVRGGTMMLVKNHNAQGVALALAR